MGASASAVTFHSVPETVGEGETKRIAGAGVLGLFGVGAGEGLWPYTLQAVVRFRPGFEGLLAEIHVLGSLLPWRKE